MHVRFLLGPAGSGKTFRCLQEVKFALLRSAGGEPLVFLAPKQATFQLERQLLAQPDLPGYTRLQILSFDRLAAWVLDQFGVAAPALLTEEGRMMVLRGLIGSHQDKLKLFRSTARLPGFVQQLSGTLREFQQAHLSPGRLRELAERTALGPDLRAKLWDFGVLLEAYLRWLDEHKVKDSESLLGLTTRFLEEAKGAVRSGQMPASPVQVKELWFDGFAEMTPQEIKLLAALLPFCERATLAFCTEVEFEPDVTWLSNWSSVNQTFRRCYNEICALPEAVIQIDRLPREMERSRFLRSARLRHLERFWAVPAPFQGGEPIAGSSGAAGGKDIRIVRCANPEAEGTFAAREVLRFVRRGNRFRDAAVLVRSLDLYHYPLRRIFARYGIPMFLDRREAVSHHPLAELTRQALRTVAYGWRHDDWFAALKTGLAPAADGEIDRLENQALASGWEGATWWQPLEGAGMLERLRAKLVEPFIRFALRLAGQSPGGPMGGPMVSGAELRPNGLQLASALESFWHEFGVQDRLEEWSESEPESAPWQQVHLTVWEQMNEWRGNVALAFADERMPIKDWLPILETGLSALTVGVIPPALDQVLVGAVDRSRNPDLKLALVLGMNESVFPVKPSAPVLLTESERTALDDLGIGIGASAKQRIAQERYLAYIACTRPQEQLVITYAAADTHGEALNASPFVEHVRKLFPDVAIERELAEPEVGDWEHETEWVTPILRYQGESVKTDAMSRLETIDSVKPILEHWRRVRQAHGQCRLAPEMPRKLYGSELRTSVSALEQYAACPFRFFVHAGLRAKERQKFEIDHREKGSFQHVILQEFHRQLASAGKRWRDVTPGEARALAAQIGEKQIESFREGLFRASPAGRFTARALIEQLQALLGTLVGWMRQYEFDPVAVELAFGFPKSPLPGWRIELAEGNAMVLRGLIDRVDLLRLSAGESSAAAAIVIDYKSSSRKLDPVKLQHGMELQLLAYLGLLGSLARPEEQFGVSRIVPVGVFYVTLRPEVTLAPTRDDFGGATESLGLLGFQHSGLFDAEWLRRLDNTGRAQGDQFRYRLKKDGQPHKRGNDALEPAMFRALLDEIEGHLRRIGNEIFAGEALVSPYRRNQETACERCEFRPICRFDPWLQPYRVLRPKVKEPVQ